MGKTVHKGDEVAWNWGSGQGTGTVSKVHTADVEKTIKGKTIKRKASDDRPAVEVKTGKGATVLKSVTEVSKT